MAKSKAKLKAVTTTDGAAFLDAMVPRTTTADGWSNATTGMGFLGRDKGEATAWRPSATLDFATLDSMGRGDGFARIIIDTVVDDAMRAGWVVNFAGDDDNEVTPEDAQKFNERLQTKYKAMKLKARVSQHLKQSRHYGGALLVIGAVDGQTPDKPLDLEKVTGFDWVRTHDRHQVTQSSAVEDEPTSIGFGFAQAYTLQATQIQTGDRSRDETLLDTWVHNSRVWRSDGVVLTERVRQQNDGWGDSVLEVCKDQLGNRASVMKSARTVIQEWVLGVYTLKNLTGIIQANGDDKVRNRFSLMDRLKSVWQSVAIDADNEKYERIATTAAGMPELLDRFGIDLAAVARMPMTKLFGLSPGGFGTGEAEGDNWDDVVQSYQTDDVGPLLEYVHKILFASPEFEDFPESWSIKFNSLQLTSPLEDADVRLKTSQADALDITSGILDASTEVAVSRYGGSGYSTETQLDMEARQMEAALEAEGLGASVADPMSGVQITSMLEILERVKLGLLPKETALVALGAAFPDMNPETASGMVNPIQVTGPESESTSTAPPAPPPSADASPEVEGAGSSEPDNEKPPSNSNGNGS